MALLNETQAARLADLATAAVPGTCQRGMAHEKGSPYCDDYDSRVPELLGDLVDEVAGYETSEELDRVAAFLYGRSAQLRAAVAAYLSASRDDPAAFLSALRQAAQEAAGEPKPGMKFEHARLLNLAGGTDKARCTVTSVRHGRVYYTYTDVYEAGDRKGAWYFKAEDAHKSVGRWL